MSADAIVYCLQALTDYAQFERLATDLMAGSGYPGIEPMGGTGDGGRDALHVHRDDGTVTVFAYSARVDWDVKLREDCRRIAAGGHGADRVGFVSTRAMPVARRDALRREVRDAYGWEVELYDVERIRMLLVGPLRHLVARHPSIFVPWFVPGVGDPFPPAAPEPAAEAVPTAAQAAALPRAFAAASAALLRWPRTLPEGEEIARPELEALVDRIEGTRSSTAVVVGAPGAGKSALLSSLAARCAARGWAVLAIKADVVDGKVSSEEELGGSLGLGVGAGVALKTLAASGPVLLVIDQLDALAAFLDLGTSRLNVLLGLVRRVGGVDNVHIVLSSRAFEFEHDVRLRAVDADFVELALPPLDRVLEILEAKGVAARDWPGDAREVIRHPQALAIYLGLGAGLREPFATYRQMLDALWAERVAKGAGGADRVRVATDVAETMAREEALWLAEARFDADREPVDQLAAAGVLCRSEGRIGFTHQTVFEHVLARGFARGEGALRAFVLERQDSLFVRPKLLAGLRYLRDVEASRYHDEVDAMWSSPVLRRHVRVLLLVHLGSQTRPTDREEAVMGRALGDPGLEPHAFRAVSGSPGWFERLADAFIAPAMLVPGESAQRMVGVLIAAWAFARDGVVALIRAAWSNDPSFDRETWAVLSRVWDWPEDALRVACAVVARTETGVHDVNYVAETLGVRQPEAALRLVHARLERELSLALASVRELEAAAAEAGGSETDESWAYVAGATAREARGWTRRLVRTQGAGGSRAGTVPGDALALVPEPLRGDAGRRRRRRRRWRALSVARCGRPAVLGRGCGSPAVGPAGGAAHGGGRGGGREGGGLARVGGPARGGRGDGGATPSRPRLRPFAGEVRHGRAGIPAGGRAAAGS